MLKFTYLLPGKVSRVFVLAEMGSNPGTKKGEVRLVFFS